MLGLLGRLCEDFGGRGLSGLPIRPSRSSDCCGSLVVLVFCAGDCCPLVLVSVDLDGAVTLWSLRY